jgi:hypothetical protein
VSFKNLRQAAQKWFADSLVGTTAETKDGRTFRFTQKGLQKVAINGAGILCAMSAIKSNVEHGEMKKSLTG